MINTEAEYVKDMDVISANHLKKMECGDVPPDVSNQKETIFRNIDDLSAFHSRLDITHFFVRKLLIILSILMTVLIFVPL